MILKDKIAEAAIEYAKKELGIEQFKNNPDAVQAISETFKDGAEWAVNQLQQLSN